MQMAERPWLNGSDTGSVGSSMDFWTTPIVVPTKRIDGPRGRWQARMGMEAVGKKAPLVLLTTEVGW
jgi:hypothetical protein